RAGTIAGIENNVEKMSVMERLREPARVGHLDSIPGRPQDVRYPAAVPSQDEEIDVLRLPRDSRVPLERVGSAHHESDARATQNEQRGTIELVPVVRIHIVWGHQGGFTTRHTPLR